LLLYLFCGDVDLDIQIFLSVYGGTDTLKEYVGVGGVGVDLVRVEEEAEPEDAAPGVEEVDGLHVAGVDGDL
jgi:hypothetical protein